MYRVAHNCHGKRINRTEKKKTRREEEPHGKKNNLKAKVKDSYNCVYYSFCAIEN